MKYIEEYIDWIKERLVVRDDFYQTWHLDKKRCLPERNLTDDVLLKHVRGEEIVVLYASSERGCKALMLDIDNHTGDKATENEKLAFDLYAKATQYQPILERSSPGGYHLWILFNDFCDSAAAYQLGTSLGGFVIPNAKPINRNYFGLAYRLPGPRSPAQGLPSAIWSGTDWVEWGDDFLDLITTHKGVDPIEAAKPIPIVPKKSRGLGDTIAKVTSAVGIKPCGGCKRRQEKLNEMFPYGNAV